MKSRGAWIAIASGLAALVMWTGMGGGVWLGERETTSTAPPLATWSDAASPIPVTSADPTWGDRDALVTVVLFADLEDPVVAHLAPTIEELEMRYRAHQLRVVWKHAPFVGHTNARDAAEAAAGCFALEGAAAFWRFVKLALANQTALSPTSYLTWASESKVDPAQLHSGLMWHRWAAKVDDDDRLAKSLHASTPTAFVNGIEIGFMQPLSEWRQKIDDELVRAKAELSSGTRSDEIYVVRSTNNRTGLTLRTVCGPVPSHVAR